MRNKPLRLRPQAGFSTVELMIAIVVMGLLLAIATPKIRETLIKSELRSARAAAATLFSRARIAALQTRKQTTVNFNASRGWVTTPDGAGGLDTVGAVVDLSNMYGVAVNSTAATLTFQPTGLTSAVGNVTVRVSRAGKSDSVVVSGYGRLQ